MSENHQKPLKDLLKDYFDQNAGLYGVEMAFLFGSRAAGFPRQDSDVDIGILFARSLNSNKELFEIITKISLDLSLEIGADANAVPLYEDFRNPMLYYNIIVKGVLIWTKDYARYLQLRNEAVYHMEDFEIFGKKWQIEITTKNLAALGHARV